MLWRNLFWFGHLHQIFESFDSSQDGLLSQAEFTDGMNQLGVRLSASEVQREFASMKAVMVFCGLSFRSLKGLFRWRGIGEASG